MIPNIVGFVPAFFQSLRQWFGWGLGLLGHLVPRNTDKELVPKATSATRGQIWMGHFSGHVGIFCRVGRCTAGHKDVIFSGMSHRCHGILHNFLFDDTTSDGTTIGISLQNGSPNLDSFNLIRPRGHVVKESLIDCFGETNRVSSIVSWTPGNGITGFFRKLSPSEINLLDLTSSQIPRSSETHGLFVFLQIRTSREFNHVLFRIVHHTTGVQGTLQLSSSWYPLELTNDIVIVVVVRTIVVVIFIGTLNNLVTLFSNGMLVTSGIGTNGNQHKICIAILLVGSTFAIKVSIGLSQYHEQITGHIHTTMLGQSIIPHSSDLSDPIYVKGKQIHGGKPHVGASLGRKLSVFSNIVHAASEFDITTDKDLIVIDQTVHGIDLRSFVWIWVDSLEMASPLGL
mmetsp:Transcript_37109/g.90206  ORF Transcript_37109/g.90206 Transcript_37109/m.90206 type:complete len:399 (+) Transcript_37109:3010-4206(+)